MISILVLADAQVSSGKPYKHIKHAGRLVADEQPDVIIEMGDWYDMPSMSSYDRNRKSSEGVRIDTDIAAGDRALDMFHEEYLDAADFDYDPLLISLGGNHDGGPNEYGSRMYRYQEQHAELTGTLPHPKQYFMEMGWEYVPFLTPYVIQGIEFCHYFPPKGKNCGQASPATQLNQRGCSTVAGHKQGLQFGTKPIAGVDRFALIAGSFYTHDEKYQMYQGNQHWRGCTMLHTYGKGKYDITTWSCERLAKTYG